MRKPQGARTALSARIGTRELATKLSALVLVSQRLVVTSRCDVPARVAAGETVASTQLLYWKNGGRDALFRAWTARGRRSAPSLPFPFHGPNSRPNFEGRAKHELDTRSDLSP
jgi:hypothetical protein